MYKTKLNYFTNILSHVEDNRLIESYDVKDLKGRMLLKHGMLIDPMNGIEDVMDIAVSEGRISEVAYDIPSEAGDVIIECDGLLVVPGLLDMHLHLGDLFEVTTNPIFCAAEDGVTTGLSPGAGNTFMAPALLGAEIDRGLPINMGVFLGAANVLGTLLEVDELVSLFTGRLDEETASKKLTRNSITNTTAALIMGIKDHMGHFIMSNENIDKIFEITSRSGLIYMSHTQDPEHTERMVALSKGRPLHLAHVTAAGCGTHWSDKEGLERVLSLCSQEHITGEFVTTMLRPGGGSREGLRMTKRSQQLVYNALEQGLVDILVSDGQNQSAMKGFGDTRDNIPALLELAEMGILSLKDTIATMTCNPARLIAQRTKNSWWLKNIGHLGIGAMANITVIDKHRKLAIYTIVNGKVVSFENRIVRSHGGSGCWATKFGMVKSVGAGNMPMFSYAYPALLAH